VSEHWKCTNNVVAASKWGGNASNPTIATHIESNAWRLSSHKVHVASPAPSTKWFYFVDLRRPESFARQTRWPEIAGIVAYPRS
jgi:hypothetical protein